MNVKKTVIPVLILVAMLLPFAFAFSGLVLPPVYENTYVGELADKTDLLKSIDEPKIIVVGGSSVAFGLNSETVSDAFSMPVVNYGLYADLGTKLMLDLSKVNIGKGDVVLISPELSAQTLSLYENPVTTLRALDGRTEYLSLLDRESKISLIGSLFSHSGAKLQYLIRGNRPTNAGAYKKENFNAYGDNCFDRPYNVMSAFASRIDLRQFLADFTDGADTEYEAFLNYVNDYIQYIKKQGATAYLTFCPMDKDAMAEGMTAEDVQAFYENLCANLSCKVIGHPADYFLDDGYFFDSEFHLNNTGVPVRTAMLINDLAIELDRPECLQSLLALDPPSGHSPFREGDFHAENPCFVLRKTSVAGNECYEITGLTEFGKTQTEITVPDGTEGLPIAGIAQNAFADSSLRIIRLSPYISYISAHAFASAENLTEVYLADGTEPGDISIPNIMNNDEDGAHLITTGANPGLKIYITGDDDLFESFTGDYFWGDVSSYLVQVKK